MKPICLLFVLLWMSAALFAQLSQGGSPLFPSQPSLLRSASDFYIEMPSFDLEEMLDDDRLNESNMRGSFRFAKKFYTSIEKGVDGYNYTLADGTRVWQVGIRSTGAYSLNILFSEYRIPEGGKLFLYNSDYSHIIGSFTHENNSEEGILPIRPVAGDELIIEYTEPADAAFEGRLKISEVNHDYRGFLRDEPAHESSSSADLRCMQDVLCVDDMAHPENIRATVLLMINGTIGCTGTLINNTENDATPYLLTAVHCLHTTSPPVFPKDKEFYVTAGGTIIAFFNYNRSVCGSNMRGTEEQTLACAIPAAIIEKKDIALLRLNDTPPDYYHPYYAGWNMDPEGGQPPYINLHHPSKALKKYGRCEDNITRVSKTFDIFDPDSHWEVPKWTAGSTAPGSSGSPLFDSTGLIVGGLSGGSSDCNGTSPSGGADYFSRLYLGREYGTDSINQLKTYLDPNQTGVAKLQGFDPYRDTPIIRLANVDYNAGTASLENTALERPASGYLFGHNSLQNTIEFAEEFTIGNQQWAEVIGAYFFIPPLDSNNFPFSSIKMKVYSGILAPETVRDSVSFYPYFQHYSIALNVYDRQRTMTGYGTENFVKFGNEPKVSGHFFVSYEIQYPVPVNAGNFSVYNTKSLNGALQNSAWIKYISGDWVPATGYSVQPVATSLAIQPVIRDATPDTLIENPYPGNHIRYVRFNDERRFIVIDGEWASSGRIELYTLTGQLFFRESFIGDNPVQLPTGNGNGQPIGVLKVIAVNQTITQKIYW